MKKPTGPFLRSVKQPLLREAVDVLVEHLVFVPFDPDQVDYARGRLATHKERSIIWLKDGTEVEIIVSNGTVSISLGSKS